MRRLSPARPPIAVVAGQGAFLARAAAEEAGLAVSDLAGSVGVAAAHAAPAAAVAFLFAAMADV
jgi:uncharacterized hydantoinase/oxoprolinase family protein